MKPICDTYTFVVLLCAVFCFDWSVQDKPQVQVQEKMTQALREQAKVCEKETGVPADTLKKIVDWSIPNDKANREFLHCLCFKSGYTDGTGHMFVEKFSAFDVVKGTKEEYVNTLKECNKIDLGDHLETIFAIGECIHKYSEFKI